MKVMLLRNINVHQGWINGTVATVTKICDNYVVIRNDKGVELPIHRFTENKRIKGVQYEISRKQFPLIPAYALTIHKS